MRYMIKLGKKNHWGGVLVYYHSTHELYKLKFETEMESIWLEISVQPNQQNFRKNIPQIQHSTN